MTMLDITNYSIIIIDENGDELDNSPIRVSNFKDDASKLALINAIHTKILTKILKDIDSKDDNDDAIDDDDDDEEEEEED